MTNWDHLKVTKRASQVLGARATSEGTWLSMGPRPDHYQLSTSESCYTVVPVYLEANVVAPTLQINRPDGAILLNGT